VYPVGFIIRIYHDARSPERQRKSERILSLQERKGNITKIAVPIAEAHYIFSEQNKSEKNKQMITSEAVSHNFI